MPDAHRSGARRASNWDLWLGVCADAAVHRRRLLSSGQLAQAARFRHRHVRRHGLPHLRSGVQGAGADRARSRVRSEGPAPNDAELGHRRRSSTTSSPARRTPRARRSRSPGTTATQRPPEGRAGPARRHARCPDQGSIFIGTKGVMLLPHIGLPVLLPEDAVQGLSTCPTCRATNHWQQFVDAVPAARARPSAQLRLLRPAHRSRAAGQRGHALPEDHARVGRRRAEVHQRPGRQRPTSGGRTARAGKSRACRRRRLTCSVPALTCMKGR